jgi:hypothetical protein
MFRVLFSHPKCFFVMNALGSLSTRNTRALLFVCACVRVRYHTREGRLKAFSRDISSFIVNLVEPV